MIRVQFDSTGQYAVKRLHEEIEILDVSESLHKTDKQKALAYSEVSIR